MRYEGTVYRPPSEARSLIVQVTIGCAHNNCTFCSMYKDKKFRIRKLEDIIDDLDSAREYYRDIKRIFLADGDALILKIENLLKILQHIKTIFPECERIGIYATPKDILNKSLDELKTLKENGLGIMYMGIESGNNEILYKVKKGVTSELMIEAGKKAKKSGIKLSVTLISGLGGRDKIKEHAMDSARVINEIKPDYVGLLTLMLEEGTELYNEYREGDFDLLSPEEVMIETKIFIENLNVNDCVFRSNHASNYISLKGVLNEDKNRLIKEIDDALKENMYKPEGLRGL
ncbi:radical SAM protein [Clostridium sp. D2Q-11]|uniref:Radical SAM protein n=1 Tax=Anaeromonas frigoriresistens TaxID=2683708 RepID=A0A942UZW2_9FIRM|nr:radical SAM protein [Anaeromonas frigoriresistens]MBS4538617.1 radical SAM protein [Anaeromonas frigoriresistens]